MENNEQTAQSGAPAELDSEQAADLAALTAAAADGTTAQVAEGEQQEEALPLDKEIAGLLGLISKMLTPALPTVAALYTPETCQQVGVSVAAVCNKHGWLQGGIGGEYKEELMCLFVVGPLTISTVVAAKSDIARIRAEAKKREQQREGETAGDTLQVRAPEQAAA